MDPLAYRLYSEALQNRWVSAKQRILVSLSGGADSTALTCLLSEWKTNLELDLTLVHFNHQIREASNQDQLFCEQLAHKLDLPIQCFSPPSPLPKKGLQQAARQWRRSTLSDLAQQLGGQRIALGHHQDDVSETLLWRVLRGTSLFGLSGMQPLETPWFRPLLGLTKAQLTDYLNRIKQPWVEDSSNQEDGYLRNRIRNQLIPLMSELAGTPINPKLAKLATESEDLRNIFHQSSPPGDWEQESLSFQSCATLPRLFAQEKIHQFLLFHGCSEINHRQIEDILGLIVQGKGGWQVNLANQKIAEGRKGFVRVRSRA